MARIPSVLQHLNEELVKYARNLPRGVEMTGRASLLDWRDYFLHNRPPARTLGLIQKMATGTLGDWEHLIPQPDFVPRFLQAGIVFDANGRPHFAGPNEMRRVKGNDVARAREFVTHEPLTAALAASTFALPAAGHFAAAHPVFEPAVHAAELSEKMSRPFVAGNLLAAKPEIPERLAVRPRVPVRRSGV